MTVLPSYPDHVATDHLQSDLSCPRQGTIPAQSSMCEMKCGGLLTTYGRSVDRQNLPRRFGFFRLIRGLSRRLFSRKKKKKSKHRVLEVQQTAILDFSSYQVRLHAELDPKFYRHSPVLFVRSLARLIVLLSFDRRMNVDHVWDYNW
jgi:hypothetical protein